MQRTLIEYIKQAGRISKGAECAIYTRDESGIITRHVNRIDHADGMEQYQHEELLAGWAERRVFWTSETGPATGAAPINY